MVRPQQSVLVREVSVSSFSFKVYRRVVNTVSLLCIQALQNETSTIHMKNYYLKNLSIILRKKRKKVQFIELNLTSAAVFLLIEKPS